MLTEADPAVAFTKLNTLIGRSAVEGRFVTMVAAILDARNNTVTMVNAGHPPPLIYHGATRTAEDAINIDHVGYPLGVIAGFEYSSFQLQLEPGDCVLAFTDGVTEAMNIHGVQMRTNGIHAAVQGGSYSPRLLVEQVVGAVKQFSAGRTQSDDMALVGFGRTL
jgi:sigma-B regulation protein RsbU (phosphoserine phosphatase)